MSTEPVAAGDRRLFFALWPDAVARASLAALVPALGATVPADARVSPAGNLHLTLAFLGATAPAVEARLLQYAKDIAGRAPLSSDATTFAAFSLTLDTVGHWPHSRVVFAAPSQMPAVLIALAAELRSQAIAAGVPMPAPPPFRAHVTLARRVATAPPLSWPLAAPIAWPIDRFALVWSRPTPAAPAYEIVASWSLPPG